MDDALRPPSGLRASGFGVISPHFIMLTRLNSLVCRQVLEWWSCLGWWRTATAPSLVFPWYLAPSIPSPVSTCTVTLFWHSQPGTRTYAHNGHHSVFVNDESAAKQALLSPADSWLYPESTIQEGVTTFICVCSQVHPPWRAALWLHHHCAVQTAARNTGGALCPLGDPQQEQRAAGWSHPGQWVTKSPNKHSQVSFLGFVYNCDVLYEIDTYLSYRNQRIL